MESKKEFVIHIQLGNRRYILGSFRRREDAENYLKDGGWEKVEFPIAKYQLEVGMIVYTAYVVEVYPHLGLDNLPKKR